MHSLLGNEQKLSMSLKLYFCPEQNENRPLQSGMVAYIPAVLNDHLDIKR